MMELPLLDYSFDAMRLVASGRPIDPPFPGLANPAHDRTCRKPGQGERYAWNTAAARRFA
jgi:hypothetical protein